MESSIEPPVRFINIIVRIVGWELIRGGGKRS